MGLSVYRSKRDFARTPEPAGRDKTRMRAGAASFVVQKHAASRLHHDFRLEIAGVLKSWAVPKGPPLAPGRRALAMQTEDHPLEYGDFEGVIPAGQYGGGTVMLWDRGTWEPEGDPAAGLRRGKLTFVLAGQRLRGRWSLVRMRADREGRGRRRSEERAWLLVKRSDEAGNGPPAPEEGEDRSVTTGRTMAEIAAAADRVWDSDREPQEEADLADEIAALPGARRAREPGEVEPQLATLVRSAPEGDEWLHEVKYDGYRLLAHARGEAVRLVTRSGQDWTDRFPRVERALARLPVRDAVVDGEVVLLAHDGSSDFQALQNSMGRADAPHVFFAFDLPHAAGHDLRAVPLARRKAILARLVQAATGADGGATLRYSDHVAGTGAAFLASACRLGAEGIVSKRVDAHYTGGRTRTWVKAKCTKGQEFVVVGWTEPAGSRAFFGALVVAYHDAEGALRYCGRVGTGFSATSLREVASRLRPLAITTPPVVNPPGGAAGRGIHWVRPELVAEIAFHEWTADGVLRQPAFRGLREDKPARTIGRDEPRAATARGERVGGDDRAHGARKTSARSLDGVVLTNPDRVLYPDLGLTKRQLAEYYASIADHVLPHVVHRPLTLVRCPRGQQAKCFYQKHATESVHEPVRAVPVDERDGTALYVAIDDLPGLLALVQMGVLEIHPWGSRTDALDRPDRIVFDIDPGEDVAWEAVTGTAHALREQLDSIGLAAFARTTGGKGLHVVVPIERRSTWPDVKAFAQGLVGAFARAAPDRFLTTASKAQRRGRIFLDYLRNDRGSTAVASYSTRARPGAPVATPLRWDEVHAGLQPSAYSVTTVPGRLAREGDPWSGFASAARRLTRAMLASVEKAR